MNKLTQKELKELLNYDVKTGTFTWLKKMSNFVGAGSVAGYKQKKGYIRIRIDDRLYYAHRLAWLLMTGEWPVDQIDHINQNKYDNKWVNLRECNQSENRRNINLQKNNTSGFKGVYWIKRDKKWRALIGFGGKLIQLGSYKEKEDAAIAYNKKALELSGQFACLNEL